MDWISFWCGYAFAIAVANIGFYYGFEERHSVMFKMRKIMSEANDP